MISILAQIEPKPEEIAAAVEFLDVGRILQSLFIIAAAYVVNRTVSATLDRLGEGLAKRRLLLKKVSSFFRIGIFAVATYMVAVTILGENETALLGLGTTLAVSIGFALKDTISSIVAGILILVDRPFQVGDRVQFGDTYGEVKEIGLRTVRIVTLDDNEVSIPNNKFLTESVSSGNAGALDMMVVMKFYISVTEDFELAKRIIYEACVTSKYVFLKKPVSIVVRETVEPTLATVLTCKAYVIDVRYETALGTDVTERVKRAFRRHRMQYPYNREYQIHTGEWDDIADNRPMDLIESTPAATTD